MLFLKKTYIFLLCTVLYFLTFQEGEAKKIRQVHKIESTEKTKGRKKKGNSNNKKKRIAAHASYLLSQNDSLSISFEADSIKFSGYDKPVTASKESFHIINTSEITIKKVGIRITYFDLKNRMLHLREETVDCYVPAGETRLTAISSWDLQHTFFYYLGPEPRRVATPYKVVIELLWVEI